jgi:hypothetical protein
MIIYSRWHGMHTLTLTNDDTKSNQVSKTKVLTYQQQKPEDIGMAQRQGEMQRRLQRGRVDAVRLSFERQGVHDLPHTSCPNRVMHGLTA